MFLLLHHLLPSVKASQFTVYISCWLLVYLELLCEQVKKWLFGKAKSQALYINCSHLSNIIGCLALTIKRLELT